MMSDNLDKEEHLNMKTVKTPLKCGACSKAAGGQRMGWNVPQSTEKFFKDVRRPLIRSTPLAVLDECPRKFLYAYKLGIIPNRYESALTMGSIVHKMLECLFLGQTKAEAKDTSERIVTKEVAKMMESVDDMGMLPSGQPLESSLKKLEEDKYKSIAMALVFWSKIPFEPGEYEVLRTPDDDPMVEVVLEATYPGLSRPARTPCDLALVEKLTGDVWIVDYKTTSLSPRIRAIHTKISAQVALYRLVLQSHLDAWTEAGKAPKRKVAGSIHAILAKPSIKFCPNTKDKAGFDSYIERLVKWYDDKEKSDPKNPPLVLDPNRFFKPLMTQELWGRLKQYCKAAQAAPNIDNFYRVGGGACLQYNKPCPYTELCNSDPSMWPDIIDRKYKLEFREDEETPNE